MNIEEILSKADHTLLKQDATWTQIKEICDDAIKYNTASVCIPASYVKRAASYIKIASPDEESKVKVCTVIGFPNGYDTTNVKVYEALEAINDGADEIDMVINIGWLKDKEYASLLDEITKVKAACNDKILKVIVETCLLTEEEKIKICEIVSATKADYIKTSTGFSTGGATVEDVKLFAKHKRDSLKIKASGGISSIEDAEAMINAGADRLGTSRIVKIVKEKEKN